MITNNESNYMQKILDEFECKMAEKRETSAREAHFSISTALLETKARVIISRLLPVI